MPKSYVFYESVVIREGSFMVFTLKDLTADTYTEVTVVQKEDGTIVIRIVFPVMISFWKKKMNLQQ